MSKLQCSIPVRNCMGAVIGTVMDSKSFTWYCFGNDCGF